MTEPRPATAAARPSAACAHCAAPIPEGATGRFCCTGCQTAHAILHEHGLEDWYRLAGREARRVESSGASFAEFDHPTFRELHVRRTDDGLAQVELFLEGVHCSACVWLVERVPLAIPGVARAELDVGRSLAVVAWDPDAVALSAIARFLDRLGYRPHPFRGADREAMRRREDRTLLTRIGVAGALATNVMLLALAQYAGWFSGMEAEAAQLFRWWSLALTVPAVLWPGRTFFTGAWAALRTRAVHMDVPVALALGAGLLRGAWNTWQGSGPIYFDGVTFLIFLLLCGRYLQQQAQRRAADAAALLGALAPDTARVVETDGAIREVPAAALLPGVLLDVRAGDLLAADGTVETGQSELDVALLTGESRPAAVGPGARVFAGTLNLSAPLRVRVDRAGEATRLGRILRDVEEGTRRRAPMVQLADRMAGRFVLVVLALAVATLVLWWPTDPVRAVDYAIAMLVVTCPCALALATPLAVHAAIGQAARLGILIKNGEALERLASPARLILDKTGTLTDGRLRLVSWVGETAVQPLVLAAEADAVHPVAHALRMAWPAMEAPAEAQVRTRLGGGVEAFVAGRELVVGAPAFVRARATVEERWLDAASDAAARGETPVLVALDGTAVALAGFADTVRPDAAAAIERLRALGFRPAILSGDHPVLVQRAAAALDIPAHDARGGATPEGKRETVASVAQREPVVMVGDGVNDAAALAAAQVGIGVHGGAEACLAAADVYLAAPGLTPLVTLADGARRTMRLIRTLLAVSLAYNAIGSVLAITGHIDPLVAAVLMPGTSILNILAAWRTRTFREPSG